MGWSFVIMHLAADSIAHVLQFIEIFRARGASVYMRKESCPLYRIDFVIHSGVQQRLHFIAGHGCSFPARRPPDRLFSAELFRHSASRARARARRDITVPRGTPVISALSS